jgi:PAS domain-containing protein
MDMGEKEPLDNNDISHGMCEACLNHFERQLDGLDLSEYLDQFDKPVLAVTNERRAIGINQPMADMLGKKREEVRGLFGGEVMECQYARLPEGCGDSIHCRDCTIRNTVLKSAATGKNFENVKAYLRREDGYYVVEVSTLFKGTYIVVMVDSMAPQDSKDDCHMETKAS